MGKRRHYRFADQTYERVIAHKGKVPIFTRRVLENSGETFLNFLDLTIVPPGADIGIHTHAMDNEEMYIIISGKGAMIIDGERFEIGPGDVVFNEAGSAHGLWNTGEEEMKLVVLEIPWSP